MTTKEVKSLQEKLNQVLKINLTLDGDYGNLTKSAVRSFQQMVGLKNDGMARPLTLEKLKDYHIEIKAAPDLAPRKDFSLGQVIIDVAKQWVGLTEVRENAAWQDFNTKGDDKERSDRLIQKMTEAGWESGWSYCAALGKCVYQEAYLLYGISKDSEIFKQISSQLNPSVMQSFHNFERLGKISKTPEKGSLFFMRKGSTGFGHMGIVESIDAGYLINIEGNTSPNAGTVEAERNGNGVYERRRPFNFSPSKGLYLVGFLNPYTS